MINLKIKKQVRFSIIVIIFGLALFLSTIYLPWISYRVEGDGPGEFHLNYEMMRWSDDYDIFSIASKLNSINILIFFIIIMGLLSLLSVSYHVASKISRIGFYLMFTSNILITAVSILIVYQYFSVIFYITNVKMITLSSPFSYFSYSFIPLVGSVVLSVISGLYGGYITSFIILQFKDISRERKKFSGFNLSNQNNYDIDLNMEKCRPEKISGIYSVTEKNDKLPPFSVEAEEEMEDDDKEDIDDHSDEFIFDEPKDDDEEKDDTSDEKDKISRIPFSFDAPIKKPEQWLQ